MAEKLMGYSELCPMLNRNYRTLHRWVKEGKFPEPIKMGNRTLGWRESVIAEWLEQQETQS